MKLSEFYSTIGQNYQEMLDRMIGKEELLKKFLKKYPTDRSFGIFETAVASGDVEQIFRAAHTLKGVSANLGLKPIVDIITPLVESTRNGNIDNIEQEFQKISKAHYDMIAMIESVE